MSLQELAGVVAPRILIRAVETSNLLSSLNVKHALIGGLAVGMHGYPRATKDVDFLVGEEAFQSTRPVIVFRAELAEAVRVGVTDFLAVDHRFPELADELRLPSDGTIPVIALEALVLMKLDANRPQDRADVHRLLALSGDTNSVVAYVKRVGPKLMPGLMRLIDQAETGSPWT